MRTLRTIALMAPLLTLPATATAGAGEPDISQAEKNAMTAKSRQLYDDGYAAYQRESWADARAAFLAAWAIHPHWQIAAMLADCELHLGRHRDAADHALYYKKNAPPDRAARAARLYAAAASKVGGLNIRVSREGADVMVDDRPLGKAPVVDLVFVEAGDHVLVASFGDRHARAEVKALEAGATVDVDLRIDEARPPQPPPPATGPSTVPIAPPPPGKSVPLIAGGVALGTAGLVSGIVLSVMAGSKGAAARRQAGDITARRGTCQPVASGFDGACKDLENANSSANLSETLGVVGLAAGGALLAATALYAVWPGGGEPLRTATSHVHAYLGPQRSGFTIEGTF